MRWSAIATALAVVSILSGNPVCAADPFEEMVRSTAPLSPAEALPTFTVPDGFMVQLVAAEDEVGKPVSMSFDAHGRLWVAETRNYPQASPTHSIAGDLVRVLSDFGAGGKARSNRVFADGLSMPDAVAPYRDGVVVFSIPNVLFLRDTDGDGVCDRREVLYGPFGTGDHHNLANNFRRGFDGWMYGGQGVGNHSVIKGSDGHEVKFSGATFRIRPEGRRIEKVGDGQANVFGLCFDPLGNLFTSDCHSMPIYQVIYGGFYPVFGKPHDGLGYAPQMLWHNHGSTAIAGLVEIHDPLWPEEYQGNFVLGNVVTSRLNRDRVETHGSTKIAKEMPDFLKTTDPWFRPVDVQMGPDGALYIADFYNRVIAHVEVRLDHPGRDRHRGRIWRVVRRGADGGPLLRERHPFQELSLNEQVAQLADPSFSHRLTVLNFLVDRGGAAVVTALAELLKQPATEWPARVGALWGLERLGSLDTDEVRRSLQHPEPAVRVHAMRILVERTELRGPELEWVRQGLHDADGFVSRAAADALARHPSDANLQPLLDRLRKVSAEDTHLVYQLRKALRDQLLDQARMERVTRRPLEPVERSAIADVCVAIPSAESARFLAEQLTAPSLLSSNRLEWIRHIARHASVSVLEALGESLRSQQMGDPARELGEFQAMEIGLQQRGLDSGMLLRPWVEVLVERWLGKDAVGTSVQTAAAERVGRYRLERFVPQISALSVRRDLDPNLRWAAAKAWGQLNPEGSLPVLGSFLMDAAVPMDRRIEFAEILGRSSTEASQGMLLVALRQAPDRLAIRLLQLLARSPQGAAKVLDEVEAGRTSPRLLQDKALRERLLASRPEDTVRLSKLSKPADAGTDRLLQVASSRAAEFAKRPGDAVQGEGVFQQTCAVCHSLAGKGGAVGPQLDGIGHRGVERLCEDILNPNRNVDRIFRQSQVVLRDGETLLGLIRREEGERLVLVNAAGNEIGIANSQIQSREELETSLMPENFSEALTESDFKNLIAYLLEQRQGQIQK